MKKALMDFTEIIDLYDSTKGEEGTAPYQQSMDVLKDKYTQFSNEKL